MSRHHIGASLWVLSILTFPAQIIAAAQWPHPYSWASNLISDLGVTTCAVFDAGTSVERYICSPAHSLANSSLIANGALLSIGAILLWNAWPKQRAGQIAMALLAIAGVLVVCVGLLPWNQSPAAHNAVALGQAPVQWAGMIVLACALRGNAVARWASAITVVSVLISVTGFALFIDAIGGGPSLALGLGIVERIAFDTLTLWGVCIGVLLVTTQLGRPSSAGSDIAPRADLHEISRSRA